MKRNKDKIAQILYGALILSITALMGACQSEKKPVDLPPLQLISAKPINFLKDPSALTIIDGKHYVAQEQAAFISLIVSDTLEDAFYISKQDENWTLSPKEKSLDIAASGLVKFQGQEFILALGSGMGSAAADSAFIVDPHSKSSAFSKNMRELYNKIILDLEGVSLKVDGLAITENALMLLIHDNLMKNYAVQIDRKTYFRYLTGVADFLPHHQVLEINLPSDENLSQVFSGASYLPAANTIMFSSINAKSNSDNRSSYIGFIPLHEPESISVYKVPQIEKEGPIELHCIALQEKENSKPVIIAYGQQGDKRSRRYTFSINAE